MATTIGIYRPGTPATLQATVNIDEKTRMIKKLMGEWHVTAEFNSHSVLGIQIGDYITWDGENYYMNRLPDITKLNNSTFQYKIDFEHSLYNLKKKLFISSDGLADFSYNGTATDFITNIVAAINEIDSGWTVGTVDSTDPITLQFTNESCHAALVRVAEAFGLEWTVASKAISLEASAGTIRELTFEYGRGSGLYKLTRQQVHDQNIITKVYGFGGDKNISEDYRNRAKRLVFAATGQEPYSASAYPYLTNNIDLYGIIEGQFTDDNIYPQRTSTLTGASISFAAAAPYAFSERSSYVEDSAMDFDINDYLIDGKVATMVFKTGDLAGVECEIWKYDHSNKRFYIRSYADVDGYVMPNYNSGSPIQPEIGDSYTLVNIAMPQTYIDTAEAALQAATQAYINKNSVPQVVYDCLFDWKYAKTQELKLDAGDKVTVTDSDLGVDAQVRIAAIEYPLVNKYKIKATIADFVPYTLQERIIKTTISTKKETVFVERRNTELARRNTMRQNQMQGMLFDSDGYFDPENIKPLSIETTYLSVGTKSRDFWLSNVTIKANYEGDANALYVTAGSLIHLQLEITGVGYEWVISTPLDQDSLTPATAYYLYAKCSTSALTGEWILSASQITTEEVSGYYHFLIGMLFAVSDDRRDFDFTNGMTYINGGTITTGKIQSIGGDSYFDLTQNKFKVGDSNSSLDWNDTAASTLTIKGALVQSPAGTTFPMKVFRGAYDADTEYFKGDEVTHGGESWLYINPTATRGTTPVEGAYWTKSAAKGTNGTSAMTVKLTVDRQVFSYDSSGANPSPASCTLTAYATGISGTLYYQFLVDGVSKQNTTASTYVYTPKAAFADMPDIIQVFVRSGSDSGTVLAQDMMTIFGIKAAADGSDGTDGTDGVDAYTVVLTNEAHTIPAASDGTVSSSDFSGSGTDIYVFSGITPVQYGTGANTFSVSIESGDAVNVTAGSASTDGLYIRRYADLSAMSADNGSIKFTIKVRDANNVETTITRLQSFAKSRAGTDGEDGTDGSSPALVYRGVYDVGKTYYGNSSRVDAVKYNDTYWRAKITAGEFSAQTPSEGTYWTAFGASFESIATGLLFAELAYIENLGVRHLKTADEGQRVTINGYDNNITFTDIDNNEVLVIDDTIEDPSVSKTPKAGMKIIDPVNSKVIYVSSNGVFSNNGGMIFLPPSTGINTNANIVGLLNQRNTDSNGYSAAIAGIDQTTSGNSKSLAGYFLGDVLDFGVMMANGFAFNDDIIYEVPDNAPVNLPSTKKIFIGNNKTTNRTWYLPDPSAYKKWELIMINNYNAHEALIYPLPGDYINGYTAAQRRITLSEPGHNAILMSNGVNMWLIFSLNGGF